MADPRILVFAGSLRTGSFNEKLAVCAAAAIEETGGAVTRVSLSDYPMPIYNGDLEKAEGVPQTAIRLAREFEAHSGIFIASPEHNAGPSALLKNTIDWLSRIRELDGRPAGIFRNRAFALGAASPGGFGGYRGLIQLRLSLELQLKAIVLPDMVSVPSAASAFDETGALVAERPGAMLRTAAEALVRESARLAGAS